jgi:putative hydrolase of the HAD superfamily
MTADSQPPRRPLGGVVFDLDDTLYPERQYVAGGYRAVGEFLRGRLGTVVAYERWLWQRLNCGPARGAFDELLRRFDVPAGAVEISELVAAYREHAPSLTPHRGLREHILPGLKNRGVRLGVLSDGFLPAQQLKFDALGLAEFFDEVLFTESLGRAFWKPCERGFELLGERLGAEAGMLAYIGDNPSKDFLAPNRLGWRSVQLRLPGQFHADRPAPPGGEAQIVLRSMAALADWLTENA